MDEKSATSICRTCLKENGEFTSVFETKETSGTNLHLSEMLSACLNLQISSIDGFPEVMCKECGEFIVQMYKFKIKVEETDVILKQRAQDLKQSLKDLYANSEIKVEEKVFSSVATGDNIFIVKPEYVIENEDSFEETVIEEFPYEEEVLTEQKDNEIVQEYVMNINDKEDKGAEVFECDICFRQFARENILLNHKMAHNIKINGEDQKAKLEIAEDGSDTIIIKTQEMLYTCTECHLIFLKKEELETHLENHHKKKFQCEVCKKQFTKSSHLTRHLKIHSIEKKFSCTTCNKSFSRQEQLNHHMSVHSGVKPHVCEICLKGFNQISNLKDHMRTHNGEKPFLCSICGKGFNQLGNLRQHTIRHSGIKAHLCSTCGNGFASKGELSAHLRKHTGARPFVCPVCNHGFTTSSSLTKHKRIHSGEKPYECDRCKMKFSRSGILARHKRTHTGEKPYVCNFCGKAFTQSNDLTSHLRIHTGEKPFICDACGQAFRQSSALKTHKRTHVDKTEILSTKMQSFIAF